MKKYIRQIKLQDGASIDEISEQLAEILTAERLDRKYILRIKLSVEEVLLSWRDNDESGNCEILLGKKSGSLQLSLSMKGACCDPFDSKADDASDGGDLGRNVMANLGIDFKFRYWRGFNYVTLFIKKKRNSLHEMAAAIGSAAVLGILLNHFAPQFAQMLNQNVLTPLFECFLGFLGAVIGPFIFLAVVCGLTSVGNGAALGRIGKTLFVRFLSMGALSSAVAGLVMLPFINFSLDTGKSEVSGQQVTDLIRLVLDIVPSNLVDAFLSGNSLQIIFIAILTGVSLVALRPSSNGLIDIVEMANDVFGTILKLITNLLPFFIFVNVLKLVLSKTAGMFGRVWWLYAMVLSAVAVLSVVQVLVILFKEKVSPVIVCKKIAPAFIVSLLTASSASSFQINLDCCEKRLGIDQKLVKISVPLGMILYKPASSINLCVLSVFLSQLYGIPVTVPIFLMMLIFSFILSVAVPPVAGGAIASYTLLFLQFGIPAEALLLAATLEVVSDFILTAFNIAFLQIEVLHLSKDMRLLNTTALKSTEQ